jgi:hypothetical protein
MALNSEQQVRLTVYGFLTFIILVAGYFFMQILNQTNSLSDVKNENKIDNRTEYASGDTSVLDSQKFKDLRPIVVPTPIASTTTTPVSDLTDDQLASLPRNPDPFSPSF